jgi:hypothetical protein
MRRRFFRRAGAIVMCIAFSAPAAAADARLHFASNLNFRADGTYSPGSAGFNLADVSTPEELDSLPAGVKALVWVGRCGGVDNGFLSAVRAYLGRSGVFGFYLMDDPAPSGLLGQCTAEHLRAESDWIHANAPGTKTFIVLMNMGSSRTPSFTDSYRPANSHVDLFGFSPYPCRTELNRCDFDMIDRFVGAAEAVGIPRDRMVPVYQTFGGGKWLDDGGGRYLMPTSAEERQILERWGRLLPTPIFDYAYSWGAQRGDVALDSAADLQTLFAQHNNAH